MNVIHTVAPISLDNLKKYFTDKTTVYVIDYKNSTLKGKKLLTYLSNLDIPCDIDFTDADNVEDMLLDYLTFTMIVNVASLEALAIKSLNEFKFVEETNQSTFVKNNKEILQKWADKLDSLTIYNMYIINSPECKQFAESFEINNDDSADGINFVSLLKNPDFYEFYTLIDYSRLKFYSHYFNDYMFKGKNMYSFWANENNPMFLLTYGISSGLVDSTEYNNAKNRDIQGAMNVTPV